MIVDWPMALAVVMVCGVFYLVFLANAGRRHWRRLMRRNSDLAQAVPTRQPLVTYEITDAPRRAILSNKHPGAD